MAGAEGLEPSTKVLETHVLPLHHAPKGFAIINKADIGCQHVEREKHEISRENSHDVKNPTIKSES